MLNKANEKHIFSKVTFNFIKQKLRGVTHFHKTQQKTKTFFKDNVLEKWKSVQKKPEETNLSTF